MQTKGHDGTNANRGSRHFPHVTGLARVALIITLFSDVMTHDMI